jgi:sec-independent protein translocase protein TatA
MPLREKFTSNNSSEDTPDAISERKNTMFPKFGPVELILILVIVTMLFGVGKLPELFGAVGRGVREFRKNSEGEGDATKSTETDDASTTGTSTTNTSSGPAAPAA